MAVEAALPVSDGFCFGNCRVLELCAIAGASDLRLCWWFYYVFIFGLVEFSNMELVSID